MQSGEQSAGEELVQQESEKKFGARIREMISEQVSKLPPEHAGKVLDMAGRYHRLTQDPRTYDLLYKAAGTTLFVGAMTGMIGNEHSQAFIANAGLFTKAMTAPNELVSEMPTLPKMGSGFMEAMGVPLVGDLTKAMEFIPEKVHEKKNEYAFAVARKAKAGFESVKSRLQLEKRSFQSFGDEQIAAAGAFGVNLGMY